MRSSIVPICLAFLVTGYSLGQEFPREVEQPLQPEWLQDQWPLESNDSFAPEIAVPPLNNLNRPSPGLSDRGGMGGPGMGDPGYRAVWYPSTSISNSQAPSDFGLVRQNISAAYPIWRRDGDTVLLSASVRNTLFFTDAILPDTSQPFPEQLWNINTGLMHIHKFDNGWSSGIRGTFGSASDKPFININVMNVSFFGFLQAQAKNERDAWVFSLFYSPVGNVEFPLPGIAYLWKPSDNFHASIGLPFSVKWKPLDELTLSFSYIPVTNINARASYQLGNGLEVYGGFEWLNEAYFLADRVVLLDRFLGFEMQLVSGLRWELATNAVLDINAGYAFNRYYGTGQSQFSDLQDQVNISPGAFLGAGLLLKF